MRVAHDLGEQSHTCEQAQAWAPACATGRQTQTPPVPRGCSILGQAAVSTHRAIGASRSPETPPVSSAFHMRGKRLLCISSACHLFRHVEDFLFMSRRPVRPPMTTTASTISGLRSAEARNRGKPGRGLSEGCGWLGPAESTDLGRPRRGLGGGGDDPESPPPEGVRSS